MRRPVIRGLILAVACGAALPELARADDSSVDERPEPIVRFFNGRATGNQTYQLKKGEARRPDEQTLRTLQVEWFPPKLDKFGHHCVVRGRLLVTDPGADKPRPIDWREGVSIYCNREPEVRSDWSLEKNRAGAFQIDEVVKDNGEFEVRFRVQQPHEEDYSAIIVDPKAPGHQFGIALAGQKQKGEEVEITWSEPASMLPESVQSLNIEPPDPQSNELKLIAHASEWPNDSVNGLRLVRAVNALQPLGKEKALGILQEYADGNFDMGISHRTPVVFWIIRCLFEPAVPGKRHPPPYLKVPGETVEFRNPIDWPLDPIVIIDDLPFVLDYTNWVYAEFADSHIDWARRHAVIRDRPLTPTGDPLQAAEKLLASRRFAHLNQLTGDREVNKKRQRDWEFKRMLVRMQAIAMLEAINWFDSDEPEYFDFVGRWHRTVEREAGQWHWHPRSQQFLRWPTRTPSRGDQAGVH